MSLTDEELQTINNGKGKKTSPELPSLRQRSQHPIGQHPPVDSLVNQSIALDKAEQHKGGVLACPSDSTAYFQAEAQRRGFRESPSTAGIAVEFSIEWPDELTKIPAPRFFISDLVFWKPLQGEDDLLESGIVIGMKYWAPGLPAIPVLPEGLEPEWQYLIYLDPNSPSRAWVKTDWASESDILLQEQIYPNAVCVEWED